MKSKQRKQLAKRTSKRAHESQEIETVAVAIKPKRGKVKHLGRVHGAVPMARADRKTRRRAREFGGGTPPVANDNEDLEMRLNNMKKNWYGGGYPAWRKDIANTNTLLPLPGGKKD